ncbi:hypothetical protein BH23ACT12_BH23ACT12_23770 [soil metagenome]
MTKEELFDGKQVIVFQKETDRRNFLKWAGIVGVGAGLAATGVGLSGKPDLAEAQTEESDLEILNYALTIEYLEADFYNQGLAGSILAGRERALIQPILEHENAHVSSLTATINKLNGTPVTKPKFKYPEGTFTDKAKFLETAVTFEELGVNAYHGQVPLVKATAILAAAASIAGVESRHAAILQDLTGGDPFPSPSESGKTMQQVLAAATPFIDA